MLKNFFVLVFFVFLFVACSGGGNNNEDDPKSSSSSYNPPTPKEDPDVTITLTAFDIALKGQALDRLDVIFSAKISITGGSADAGEGPSQSRFDSVLVKLGSGTAAGKVLNADKKSSTTNNFQWTGSGIDISSSIACGEKVKVCYEVYAKGNKDPLKVKDQQEPYCKEETRAEAKCATPSSASGGDNSVVSLDLEPVSFGGNSTIRITSTEGVNLSTGTSTNAHLFFSANPDELTTSGGAQITSILRQSNDDEGSYPGVSKGDLPNPTKTSQVTPRSSSFSASADYVKDDYYVVKVVSGDEWGSGWFLILSETQTISNTTGIDIKAWKVK
ncbi:MAG: hypothetical protein LBH25_00315 [Fibromonadaceae bacterium]|nr:hypothetical protein [Fibromonadaceae bacterium]